VLDDVVSQALRHGHGISFDRHVEVFGRPTQEQVADRASNQVKGCFAGRLAEAIQLRYRPGDRGSQIGFDLP